MGASIALTFLENATQTPKENQFVFVETAS